MPQQDQFRTISLSDLRKWAQEKVELPGQIEALNLDLRQENEKLEGLNADLAHKKELRATAEHHVEQLLAQQKSIEIQGKITERLQNIKELEEAITTNKSKINEINDQISPLNEKINLLNEYLDVFKLPKQIAINKDVIAVLEPQSEKARVEIEQLKLQLKDVEQFIRPLSEQLADAEQQKLSALKAKREQEQREKERFTEAKRQWQESEDQKENQAKIEFDESEKERRNYEKAVHVNEQLRLKQVAKVKFDKEEDIRRRFEEVNFGLNENRREAAALEIWTRAEDAREAKEYKKWQENNNKPAPADDGWRSSQIQNLGNGWATNIPNQSTGEWGSSQANNDGWQNNLTFNFVRRPFPTFDREEYVFQRKSFYFYEEPFAFISRKFSYVREPFNPPMSNRDELAEAAELRLQKQRDEEIKQIHGGLQKYHQQKDKLLENLQSQKYLYEKKEEEIRSNKSSLAQANMQLANIKSEKIAIAESKGEDKINQEILQPSSQLEHLKKEKYIALHSNKADEANIIELDRQNKRDQLEVYHLNVKVGPYCFLRLENIKGVREELEKEQNDLSSEAKDISTNINTTETKIAAAKKGISIQNGLLQVVTSDQPINKLYSAPKLLANNILERFINQRLDDPKEIHSVFSSLADADRCLLMNLSKKIQFIIDHPEESKTDEQQEGISDFETNPDCLNVFRIAGLFWSIKDKLKQVEALYKITNIIQDIPFDKEFCLQQYDKFCQAYPNDMAIVSENNFKRIETNLYEDHKEKLLQLLERIPEHQYNEWSKLFKIGKYFIKELEANLGAEKISTRLALNAVDAAAEALVKPNAINFDRCHELELKLDEAVPGKSHKIAKVFIAIIELALLIAIIPLAIYSSGLLAVGAALGAVLSEVVWHRIPTKGKSNLTHSFFKYEDKIEHLKHPLNFKADVRDRDLKEETSATMSWAPSAPALG